jgi:hypothetical protein
MTTLMRRPTVPAGHFYRISPTRQTLSVCAACRRDGICDTDKWRKALGPGESACCLRRSPTVNINPAAPVTPPAVLPPDKSP